MAQNLFFEKEATCPGCRRRTTLKYVNPKLYVAESRETDRHVTAYKWLQGVKTDTLPHHYAVWQCPSCMFADFRENVEEQKGGSKDRHVLTAFVSLPPEGKQILSELRKMVPHGEIGYSGAVAIHLAAVYIHSLPEEKQHVDHGKRGRFLMRLAWLYREIKGKCPSSRSNSGESLTKLGHSIENFEISLAAMRENLQEISALARERAQELHLPERPEENPYLAVTGSISDKMDAIHALFANLQMAVLQDQQGKITQQAPAESEGPVDLDRSLLSISKVWPGILKSEKQCLLKVVEDLEYSFQYETDSSSTEQSISIINLILDILVRMGELDKALSWITDIYKYVSNTKMDLQRRVDEGRRSKTLSEHDESMINRKIGVINMTVQKCMERRQGVVDQMLVRDKEKIDDTLLKTAQLPMKEREKALLESGVADIVVMALKKNNRLAEEEEKKTGWFRRR